MSDAQTVTIVDLLQQSRFRVFIGADNEDAVSNGVGGFVTNVDFKNGKIALDFNEAIDGRVSLGLAIIASESQWAIPTLIWELLSPTGDVVLRRRMQGLTLIKEWVASGHSANMVAFGITISNPIVMTYTYSVENAGFWAAPLA